QHAGHVGHHTDTHRPRGRLGQGVSGGPGGQRDHAEGSETDKPAGERTGERAKVLAGTQASETRTEGVHREASDQMTLRVRPPSTQTFWPVMYDASGDARKAHSGPKSSARPRRRCGTDS